MIIYIISEEQFSKSGLRTLINLMIYLLYQEYITHYSWLYLYNIVSMKWIHVSSFTGVGDGLKGFYSTLKVMSFPFQDTPIEEVKFTHSIFIWSHFLFHSLILFHFWRKNRWASVKWPFPIQISRFWHAHVEGLLEIKWKCSCKSASGLACRTGKRCGPISVYLFLPAEIL